MGQSVQQEKTQMSASRGDGMWTLWIQMGCLKSDKLNLSMQIKFLLGEVSNAVGQPGLEPCVIHLDCGYPPVVLSLVCLILCARKHTCYL